MAQVMKNSGNTNIYIMNKKEMTFLKKIEDNMATALLALKICNVYLHYLQDLETCYSGSVAWLGI